MLYDNFTENNTFLPRYYRMTNRLTILSNFIFTPTIYKEPKYNALTN